VDFVSKLEKQLRKRHHSLMTEVAKIEHLIDAFEKGAKRGLKKGGSRLSAAARKKISLAQKVRWAKARKAKAGKG
jgi:ABC-type protease/lipase transport system fused ATPase/permease subunit